jgi:hypothetical protein
MLGTIIQDQGHESMSVEEHGAFFIERRTMSYRDGTTDIFFAVGAIVEQNGERIFVTSELGAYDTRDEAVRWIEGQQKRLYSHS